jgi:AraC-like DNA-binding protein
VKVPGSADEMTTIASAATLLARTLEQSGHNARDIYAQAGLEAAPAQPLDARYPVSRMQVVWALAVETTGDACLGLRVAEQMQPQVLHGLGFAWLTSDTLFDALQRLVRYQRVISTLADFRLRTLDTAVELSLELKTRELKLHPAVMDAALAVAVRMCRLALQSALQPVRVSFKHSPPDCAQRFADYFGCPVEFSAPVNAVYFDAKLLEQSLPSANPELARVNDRVVIDYLSRFDRESLSMRVRARLIDQLPDGQPSQAQVADALHMSVRNLQRRLQQEGSSFKQLLDETRRELAVQYVRQNHRPIGEITYLLGFSEPSNFTRAFRRWTGYSPHVFREQNLS